MLDETIDIFTERMKEIVLTDKNMTSIPLAYLMTLDIPEEVRHFFIQEVEMWIREEEEKFESDRFDYDQPEVRMLIDQIFDRLQQNAVFELTRFNHLLERAIKLELTYIVKPHRTLTQFIFRNNDTVSTIEVYDTLKYFSKLSYYKEAISDYFNTKYMHSITMAQFKDLIDQIDEERFEEDRLQTVMDTIKEIMETIGEARQTAVNTLTTDVLYDAVSDRNLDEYSELIQKVKYETDISELNYEDIERLLRDKTLPGNIPAEQPAAESVFAEYSTPEPTVEPETEPADDGLSLKLEFEEEERTETTETVADSVSPEPATVDPAPEAPAEPVAGSGNVASDLADFVAENMKSDAPLEPLDPMITGRLRRRIIRKLFKRNEQEYLSFIGKLDRESSWKVASRIIDDEFYTREINPYSKEAISLSDVIYLRFFPKDKYVGDNESEKW